MHGASNRDMHLYLPLNSSSVHLITTIYSTCGAMGGPPMKCGVGGQLKKTPHFHPRHQHPPIPDLLSQEELDDETVEWLLNTCPEI